MVQQELGIRDKIPASVAWGLPTHLVKRLIRLSGLVPLGTWLAILGSWVLLLPTIPLMSAARVVKCRATMPGPFSFRIQYQ